MKIKELTIAQDQWTGLDQHIFTSCQQYLQAVNTTFLGLSNALQKPGLPHIQYYSTTSLNSDQDR